MDRIPDFHIFWVSSLASNHPGFYFAFPDDTGAMEDLHGPYPTRYAACLGAIEHAATTYLETEEQGN